MRSEISNQIPEAVSRRWFRLILFLVTFLSFANLTRAAVTESIQSFSITNYTGYVIASDLFNLSPSYNRDAIRVTTEVRYSSFNTESADYRIEFRLLDADDNPVSIRNHNGVEGTVYYIFDDVSVTSFVNKDIDYDAAIIPMERLDAGSTYTAEVRISTTQNTIGGIYQFTGDSDTDGPRTYYHFQNILNNDLPLNVIPRVSSVNWVKNYLVDTDPAKDELQATVGYALWRYDNFLSAVSSSQFVVHLDLELVETNSMVVVPLEQSRFSYLRSLNSYVASAPKTPKAAGYLEIVDFRPGEGQQLDPVNGRYELRVKISYDDPSAIDPLEFNERASLVERVMHFNGNLLFGGVPTVFESISNDPTPSIITGSYIRTTINVDANSGSIPGSPEYFYGDNSPILVNLQPNGNAILFSGTVDVNSSNTPDTDSVFDVRIERLMPMTLNNNGLFSDLKVHLPAGSGYKENAAQKYVRDDLLATNVELNTAFRPKFNVSFGGPFRIHEETKPVWIDVSDIEWKVSFGEFVMNQTGGAEYVRENEHVELDTIRPSLLDPSAADKKSNELYYRSIGNTVSATGLIEADSNGVALLTTDWDFVAGEFETHFPYSVKLNWAGTGLMEVDQDQVVPTTSKLTGADVVNVSYARDCPDGGCGPGAGEDIQKLVPATDEYFFTRDGGLSTSGMLTQPRDLEWGYIDLLGDFAHQSLLFTDASFLMSGTFLRGDQSGLGKKDKPGVLLLSGFDPALSFVERPGTNPYQEGLADYAGMNFRVGTDGAFDAHSYLAGKATGDYPLTGRSKYYVRKAGLTGIHEAVSGAFPATAELYGYQVNFDNFGLSFLDNENLDSRTEGLISVDYPSDFDQEFEELKFLCNGALDSATVPDGTGMKLLSYWIADFQPLAIDFRRNPVDQCDPGIGFLVLGVEAYASHVAEPLFGSLGFESSGQIITPSFGLEGVDSRLKLPNTIKIDGPAEEVYTLNPVSDAYYNHEDVANKPANGFINISGSLDVPFFENLQIHLHTSAQQGNDIAPIYMMGGWPSHGWETTPGQNYFTATPYDLDHLGFPTSGPVDHYRKVAGPDTEAYRPRAMRTWLKVVNFDYPLVWSSSTRSFRSWQPTVNDFMVISAEHQIDYMSALNAEISFGVQYDGLPQVNIANMAFNAIDQATGVVSAFADAGLAPVRRTIEVGVNRMDDMLNDQAERLMDPILDQTVDPMVDSLYSQLENAYDSAPDVGSFRLEANKLLDGLIDGTGGYAGPTSVKGALSGIVGSNSSAAGVLQELDDALAKAEKVIRAVVDKVDSDPDTGDAISAVGGILSQELDGEYAVVGGLVIGLVDNLASEYLGSVTEGVDAALEKAQPTIQEISVRLNDVADLLAEVRSRLNGDVLGDLQGRVAGLGGTVQGVSDEIRNDVNGFFDSVDYSLASPFDEYPENEIKQEIRQAIEDRFYGSEVTSQVQTGVKEFAFDIDASLREHLDSAMGTVNQTIRDLIGQALAGLDTAINDAIGDIGSKMGSAQIDGYAHINGDSLRKLRLDGRFVWTVPDEMVFNAYLQICELDSDGSDGCNYGGEPATEVSLGATDVAVEWLSPDLRINASTKFTFGSNGHLRGMGGAFEIEGGLSFEAFEVTYFGAAVAFGLDENYLSAAVGLRFNQYEAFGGIYFGRTCSLDPIALWAPEVADVLGTPPFTGFYVYAEVWMPLNEMIGIPSTCLFNITAGVGAGAFYFIEGPTYGGNMLFGVSGEALCIVSIKGEIKLVGVKNGANLRMKGSGRFEGTVGPCPFCIEFGKTVGLTYDGGSWDVSM